MKKVIKLAALLLILALMGGIFPELNTGARIIYSLIIASVFLV